MHEFLPQIILEIRYCSSYNFIGKPIEGYISTVAIITKHVADALKISSENLTKNGYMLKIFDTFRPTRAVNHIIKWAIDENDTITKKYFYPTIEKST